MIESKCELAVRYYETDLMGIVHHSNYIRYFECGRHKLLLDYNIPIEKIEEAGVMMPVISTECNYRLPARMGDTLTIVTRIRKMPAVKIEVECEIFNQRGERVCDGMVKLCFVHSQTRKPTRIPQIMAEKFEHCF